MEESQTTAIKSLEELEDENESRTIPIWLAFLICFGKWHTICLNIQFRIYLCLRCSFLYLGTQMELFYSPIFYIYFSFYDWIGY
jgi:hypothetical protein